MEETKHYYYFYCEVPEDRYNKDGYDVIYDREYMGAWRKVKHSGLCWLDISENRKVFGEVHYFRYIDQTPTSWRMKIIGIPHLEPNMVICMVYETANSEIAESVKNEAYAKSK
nr:hypothetical protein [Tanacetum cinerariifolium]